MKRNTPRSALAGFAIIALTVLSACGDDDDASDSTAAGTEPPAATAGAPDTTAAGPGTTAAGPGTTAETGGGTTVGLAESGDLGQILVDAEGRTLYMFAPDAQGPSTCSGGCAEAWPALTGSAEAGEGVDGALLGTAGDQVTYNDWPLYYFSGDAAPGDVNGQGSNDVWYVVGAAGEPIGMS